MLIFLNAYVTILVKLRKEVKNMDKKEKDKKTLSEDQLNDVSGGEIEIKLTGVDAENYMNQHVNNGFGYSGWNV